MYLHTVRNSRYYGNVLKKNLEYICLCKELFEIFSSPSLASHTRTQGFGRNTGLLEIFVL